MPDIKPKEIATKEDAIVCKGLVFRGELRTFVQEDRIGQRIGLRLLKRKSCPGCAACGWIWEDAQERSHENDIDLSSVEHGELYTLKATGICIDHETGCCDDYDLSAVEIREE